MKDRDQQPDQEAPSKTQRKNQMHSLQTLGEKLTGFSASMLEACNLPQGLLDALEEHKHIPDKHGARKRHMQFIGKQMRELSDGQLKSIEAQLHQNVEQEKKRLRELEELRERLLSDEGEALTQLIDEHHELDIQHLRNLIRQAKKEREENGSGTDGRKLFQYLRDVL